MVKQRTTEIAACPVLETDPGELAKRSLKDAKALIHDVRQQDPSEVWGRLSLWHRSDPERLYAVVITLAAITSGKPEIPEWVANLAGGLTALQPQTQVPRMRGAM